MPFQALLSSFGVILVTEIGDKTMLTTMCISAQYRRPTIVLLAALIALAISTAIAVIVGVVLAASLPVNLLVYISGALFIGLGIYTIFNSDSEEVDSCDNPATFTGMISLILFSELGDKSQIAALALAAQSIYPIMVFTGAILGFLIVNALGVIAGDRIAGITSMKHVKRIAGIVFIIFGLAVLLGIL
ncbi:MAG: TMEM165/GDT1 family protein [Candidatus Thorarchaeota archaeon]